MDQPASPTAAEATFLEETISDDTMLRRIAYCGVLVTATAIAIAWVANAIA